MVVKKTAVSYTSRTSKHSSTKGCMHCRWQTDHVCRAYTYTD